MGGSSETKCPWAADGWPSRGAHGRPMDDPWAAHGSPMGGLAKLYKVWETPDQQSKSCGRSIHCSICEVTYFLRGRDFFMSTARINQNESATTELFVHRRQASSWQGVTTARKALLQVVVEAANFVRRTCGGRRARLPSHTRCRNVCPEKRTPRTWCTLIDEVKCHATAS